MVNQNLPALLKHRHDLPKALNALGLVGEGAEIGVWRFDYANIILKTWKGQKYHCIDPWIKQPPQQWRGVISKRNDWDDLWQKAQKRAQQEPRIQLHRMFSHEAAPRIADASLDWVYVDGNHSKENVVRDLDLWWTKVKPGGILGGHDYMNDTGPPHWIEVKTGLLQWVARSGIFFFVTPCTSWWTRKPK